MKKKSLLSKLITSLKENKWTKKKDYNVHCNELKTFIIDAMLSRKKKIYHFSYEMHDTKQMLSTL